MARSKLNYQAQPQPDQLLGIEPAALMLGIAPQTLRNWICMGRLETVKLGGRRLLRASTIEAIIARATEPAKAHPQLRL